MRAQTERMYDEYERMAYQAMMMRGAYHAKKLKQSDLFERPKDGKSAKVSADDIRAKQAETMRWLSQFEEFRGKE